MNENRITSLIEKSLEKRSIEKKPTPEFNPPSGSKTARYQGIKW